MPLNTLWFNPPQNLELGDPDVHLWRAELAQSMTSAKSFLHLLSPDEIERAERFHFQKDRDRFIIARAILRSILGRYLKTDPCRLEFSYGAQGKPALSSDFSASHVRFNMSHSRDLALYAVARSREVGVDLEYLRSDIDVEKIAEQYFSDAEVAALRASAPNRRTEAFFNCWTRKEAYIKGRGEGISLPLNRFSVSLTPGEPASLLSAQKELRDAHWSLHELMPGPGYTGAVAIEGEYFRLRCWQWSE